VARRRAVVVGGALALIVVAALLVRGCLEARQERAFEDYVQEAASLVSESSQEGEALFELLEDPTDLTAVEVQNTLNGLSVDAERLTERGETAEPPDELADAHDLVVQMLELRRVGLEGISSDIPAALGDEQRDEAIEAIAIEMRSFLASDVIYADQAAPTIEEVLDREELAAEVDDLPDGQFLPDIEWLQPDRVDEAIAEIPTSDESAAEEPVAP
jgi:hypothetical protein